MKKTSKINHALTCFFEEKYSVVQYVIKLQEKVFLY